MSVKLGIHKWNAKLAATGAGNYVHNNDSGTDILVGVGAEYNLSNRVSFIAGLHNYTLGDERIPKNYLGLIIGFGGQ